MRVVAPTGPDETTTFAALLTHYDGASLARTPPLACPDVALPALAATLVATDAATTRIWPPKLRLRPHSVRTSVPSPFCPRVPFAVHLGLGVGGSVPAEGVAKLNVEPSPLAGRLEGDRERHSRGLYLEQSALFNASLSRWGCRPVCARARFTATANRTSRHGARLPLMWTLAVRHTTVMELTAFGHTAIPLWPRLSRSHSAAPVGAAGSP